MINVYVSTYWGLGVRTSFKDADASQAIDAVIDAANHRKERGVREITITVGDTGEGAGTATFGIGILNAGVDRLTVDLALLALLQGYLEGGSRGPSLNGATEI